MLQLLETGKALYVLAAVCFVGIASKLITRSLYKRLIKETDNMVLTKNRNLKTLKQKIENAYRVNQVIANTQTYIEKQLYGFKFMKFSLDAWNGVSSQMALLCLMVGGAASFLSYWYRLDSYYIVLYGSMGIMAGLLTVFVDNGANISGRRQWLSTVLQEYTDNSAFIRATRERDMDTAVDGDSKRGSMRGLVGRTSNIRERDGSFREVLTETQKNTGFAAEETAPVAAVASARGGRSALKRGKSVAAEEAKKEDSRKDIDYLKNSLEQIAASREKGKPTEDWTKGLNNEEIKVIGDIIREYFGNN